MRHLSVAGSFIFMQLSAKILPSRADALFQDPPLPSLPPLINSLMTRPSHCFMWFPWHVLVTLRKFSSQDSNFETAVFPQIFKYLLTRTCWTWVLTLDRFQDVCIIALFRGILEYLKRVSNFCLPVFEFMDVLKFSIFLLKLFWRKWHFSGFAWAIWLFN